MNSGSVKCDKCGLWISAQSKLIHSAQCNPVINNLLNNNSSRVTNTNRNSFPNNFCETQTGIKNNIPEEEFWFCEKCQNYLEANHKEDHILSHRYQDLDEEHRNEDDNMMDTDEINSYEIENRNLNNLFGNSLNRTSLRQNNGSLINTTTFRNNPFINSNTNNNVVADTESEAEENININNIYPPRQNHSIARNPFSYNNRSGKKFFNSL